MFFSTSLLPSAPLMIRCLATLALVAGLSVAHAHHAPGHEGSGGDAAAGAHGHHPAAATADKPAAGVRVADCWIRAMPANLPSAGYFTVHNDSSATVTLSGVASDDFGSTMLHQTQTKDGVARMLHVEGVQIPAGGEQAFAPSGYHAMLEKPKDELTVGGTKILTLQFGDAGTVAARCAVQPPSALGPTS